MPSWNIHTAHVEKVLLEEPLESLGVRDANAFLFGNLAPDVYVGYMVPDASRKIPYKDTHFADPTFVPAPNASQFYESYVMGTDASDVALGAWTHLLCDHYYNLRTVEFIDKIGVKSGEQTRIRKQRDFDLFGRTLDIAMTVSLDDGLVAQCAAFPQYPIDEVDVAASIRAQASIVERNRAEHVDGVPEYCLLTSEFFRTTFDEVHRVLCEGMRLHAAGKSPLHLGRS